jgi:ATP-dependent Clp protease protease subunit
MNLLKYLIFIFYIFSIKALQNKKINNGVIILKDDNFVTIRGEIDGNLASQVITKMMSIQTDTMYLYLITPGGSVTDGMQIIQTMKALEKSGKKIICIANVALSMGFVILQYCNERVILQSSIVMQHQTSLKLNGPLNNVDSYMSFIHSMGDEIDEHQSERLGMSLEEFKNKINHDWWLFGNNILKNKVADKMAWIICNFENSNEREENEVTTPFGKVKLSYSKCPIAIEPLDTKFPENMPLVEQSKFATYRYIFDKFN